MKVYNKIIKFLDETKVDYYSFEHEFIHTSEDAAKLRESNLEDGAKALVLKAKSGNYYLFVVPGNMRADLKKVKELIGEKNVSLASPDEAYKVTGCKVGSVPPLGNLFGIPVYFDKHFLTRKEIAFSAGSHYHSIKMKPQDFIRIVKPVVESYSRL